jgi:predicted AAA+ superfamily ATPase
MIQRTILPEIEKWLDNDKILILKGPRQVGKTTIMQYLQEKLNQKGQKTLYFTADIELGNDLFASSKNFINFLKTQI